MVRVITILMLFGLFVNVSQATDYYVLIYPDGSKGWTTNRTEMILWEYGTEPPVQVEPAFPAKSSYLPEPIVFTNGFETSEVVFTSETNATGFGYFAHDDGTLLSYTNHASPRVDEAEKKIRKARSIATHEAKKAKKESDKQIVKDNKNANVKDRLDALEEYLGINE